MISENFEKIYYSVAQYGMYYRINKIGVIQTPDGEEITEGDPIKPENVIMAQYLYPISHSYVQSIVNEIQVENVEGEIITEYIFGLLLINSLSRGTFVFSAQGLENSEYIDESTGVPFYYESLLDLFTIGKRESLPSDGIK